MLVAAESFRIDRAARFAVRREGKIYDLYLDPNRPDRLPQPSLAGDRYHILASAIPIFYDCEASGLDGVPIEIGWAFADAQTGAIASEGHLVRPPLNWPVEESWDPAAEALHGITLDQLRAQGCSVWEIAQRMNRVLAGRELFSDSPLDEVWLTRILNEAGLDPSFTIRRMDAEVLISKVAADRGLDAGGYVQAKTVAARLAPRVHRAEADARNLAVLWNIVSEGTFRP